MLCGGTVIVTNQLIIEIADLETTILTVIIANSSHTQCGLEPTIQKKTAVIRNVNMMKDNRYICNAICFSLRHRRLRKFNLKPICDSSSCLP